MMSDSTCVPFVCLGLLADSISVVFGVPDLPNVE